MNEINLSSWREPKTILLLVGILVVGLIVSLSILRDRIVGNTDQEVVITGQGKVVAQPDTARVDLGVQVDRASSADAALSQLNDKIKAITKTLTDSGIPKENIKTQNYSLYPQYDYKDGENKLAGYSANQTLNIKIENIDESTENISKAIDVADKAGANQVQGVSFEVSNIEDYRQQARIAAIADAKTKARDVADAAGVKLGRILGWTENGGPTPGPVPYYDSAKGAGGVAADIPAGTQDIVVNVGVRYRIK